MKIFQILALFVASSVFSSAYSAPLPNPVPFLRSQEVGRQDPLFQVTDFSYYSLTSRENTLYEQPSFQVGNKAVVVRRIDGRNRPDRDSSVAIYIDGKEVGRFMWWGSFEKDGKGSHGYPFEDKKDAPASLEIDKRKRTITYTKPYLTTAGKTALFRYHIKSLRDSKIEISWEMGITQKELDMSPRSLSISLWFSTKSHRGQNLVFGGKPFKEATRETLLENTVKTEASGNLTFSSASPIEGYKIEFGSLRGQITESVRVPKSEADVYELTYRTSSKKRQARGRIVIDLGEASLASKNTPPPVGGIDFWQIDKTHVPTPATRNVMPNPSFEQGLRYWRWADGGATYTPDKLAKYDIVPDGKFGKKALVIRGTQSGAPPMRSMPISLEKDQKYTLSFYAKAKMIKRGLTVSLESAARGGKFQGKNGPFGDNWSPDSKFSLTAEWRRYHRTFTADSAGICILFISNDATIDGIQLEKGTSPTEFVAPPLDGLFTTKDKDNSIVKGTPIDAGFTFTGKPGTRGKVAISVKNAFSEILYSEPFELEIGEEGLEKISLPLGGDKLGEGLFVVRAKYEVAGLQAYYDYYRFSIMKPLSNTHATKNIFGAIGRYPRITRGEDLAKKYMEWGFGSTSWGYSKGNAKLRPYLEKKYRIANIATLVINEDREMNKNYRDWTSISPEMEKKIEEIAYEAAKLRDPEIYNVWSFGNEEEGSFLVRSKKFDEYFKAQYATAKGVKRANPNAIILPTCGTSGYSRLRGYDAIEGYLQAAQKHDFKYDAIAVHPYGSIDEGTLSKYDLDEETARLIAQMKRYGYGKETPIYYTELFNTPDAYIPQWNADDNYDLYQSGKATYDFGNREFIHAASAARAFIIMLKYWPHVQSSNIWVSKLYLDQNLTPLMLCKAVNTLGNFLGDVEYRADIKPFPGVRGYVFKLKDGTAIAPIWCINHDVENGLSYGPELDVRFKQPVEFYDFMGNQRFAKTTEDGVTKVQLTPAPLLMKANDIELLVTSLQNAETTDSSAAVTVSMQPQIDGNIIVSIKNLTGRVQKGKISIGNKKFPYSIAAEKVSKGRISKGNKGNQFGKMYQWEDELSVEPAGSGKKIALDWKMDYFYVPKTNGEPNWNNIPSIPLKNRFFHPEAGRPKAGPENDLEAEFKMAWDKENLYLRVEAVDDNFLTFPTYWEKGDSEKKLYDHDGCLEVYFDTGADARTNEAKTYDNNDYRYDFSVGKLGDSGPGRVYRLREVNHQLADGVNMASKEEASREITCRFYRTKKGYAYTIIFPQRYIEPIVLREGSLVGFGMFLHDRDDASTPAGAKGLSLATEKGSHCDGKPHLWPLMILSER